MEIRGSVMIITGASSGIGAATARRAAARGARVVLAARRAERLEALADEIGDGVVVPTDMRDPDEVRRLMDATLGAHGRVDVLVNNAGQGLVARLEDVSLDDLVAITELNVYGPLVAMQAAIGPMRAQGGGVIVNVSSGTTRGAFAGVGAYSATKQALNTITDVARVELLADGIIVSSVVPFLTETEFASSVRSGAVQGGPPPYPPASAEQVAEAILGLIESGAPEAVLLPAHLADASETPG